MDDNEQKKLSPDLPSGLSPTDADKEKQAAFAIVKPLRTFERDIAESIRKTNASVASINVMEQKKKEENKVVTASLGEKTQKIAWGGIATLASVVLIICAVGVLGFLYYAYKSKPPIVTAPEYSVISTDQVKKVDATDVSRDRLIKLLSENLEEASASSAIGNHTITEIKLIEKVIPKDATPGSAPEEKQISSEQFMSLLAGSAPASLARAFEGPWAFGFYNGDHAEPFILANISSFDNAFDGMIRWESGMAKDLQEIIPDVSEKSFEDLVIKSKNVRVLKDARGNSVLLYSFLSEKYILITTNDEVFKEILNRFLTSKVVR